MVSTYAQLYVGARKALLAQEDVSTAAFLSRQLLCSFSGKSTEYILANPNETVSEEICDRVWDGVKRILDGEPLAYVLGEWEFFGLKLVVSPSVLIPRDDTCAVTELAVKQAMFLNQDPRVLDLCCGSGCIGLAIASKVKDARIALGDLSMDALQIAKKNIALNKVGGRVSCVHVNAMEPATAFLGKFDMIVSNPPYITGQEMEELPHSVKDYEPHMALFGGEDGLDFYRAIVKNYSPALKPGGYLCFEFGMGQGDAVCAILESNGFTILERKKDYNDRERAVLAQYGRKEY